MKVLISGASGFLGSWISRVISEIHDVTALVRVSSSLSRISDIRGIEIVRLEPNLWADSILELRPDVLILTDWSGVGNEFRNDVRQFNNVERIRVCAHAAQIAGVKTVIGVGSQAELGPIISSISEDASDKPTTLYGEAKVEARKALDGILSGSDIRFVWMRIFSTYGPLDEGSWLIPNIINSLTNGEKMKLTQGEQIWSYLHAFDLAMAFATVIKNENINGIVNVGNPQTISIYKAALTIGRILEKEELLEFGALDYRPDQIMRLQPLCETLIKAGWHPQISFEEGIRQTIDWLERRELRPVVSDSGQPLCFNLPVRL